jgi:hypothetical protein
MWTNFYGIFYGINDMLEFIKIVTD